MDSLSLAIQARVPFIHITTDDTVYANDVLSFIAETEVKGWSPKANEDGKIDPPPAGSVLCTNLEGPSPALYLACKKAGTTLVFINTKPQSIHHSVGKLFPPKDMLVKYLTTWVSDSSLAQEILPSFGGMTIKGAFELIKLTNERVGEITPHSLNSTRQGFVAGQKGVTQVLTGDSFYQVPDYLGEYLESNVEFFKNNIHKDLTPRGLLFTGDPGTGKTSGAKHVAESLGVPLYHLDISTMKGKYVGDSETNLNAGLAQIDMVSPCVVLIDEIEKVFTSQGDQGTTTSMLSSLLWWLQEHQTKVFTIMTSNDIRRIPRELYRKGRIDEVMDFKGLQALSEVETFAKLIFDRLSKEVWGAEVSLPTADPLSQLMGRLAEAFNENKGSLTQSFVINEVHTLVKAMYLAAKNGGTIPAPAAKSLPQNPASSFQEKSIV